MNKAIRIVNTVVNIAEVFLAVRFLLRLLGANPASPFTRWWYNATDPLLYPFRGIFPTTVEGGFVFDFSTLFAIAAYAVIGYLITALIDIINETTVRNRRSI